MAYLKAVIVMILGVLYFKVIASRGQNWPYLWNFHHTI